MVIIGAAPMITVVERFADRLPRGDGSDLASCLVLTGESFRLSLRQRPRLLLRQARRITARPQGPPPFQLDTPGKRLRSMRAITDPESPAGQGALRR